MDIIRETETTKALEAAIVALNNLVVAFEAAHDVQNGKDQWVPSPLEALVWATTNDAKRVLGMVQEAAKN